MADKFDIAEHIKVEALGYRAGTSIDEEYFSVKETTYARADYTLNFAESGATSISSTPLTTAPEFFIINKGLFGTSSTNYTYDVVFKAPTDGSYRVNYGGAYTSADDLTAGEYATMSVSSANLSFSTSITVQKYETYIDSGGYTRDRSLGSVYTSRVFQNAAEVGYYLGETVNGTNPSIVNGKYRFRGLNYMKSQASIDTNVVGYKIGVTQGQGYEYPQFYVDATEEEYYQAYADKTIRTEITVDLPYAPVRAKIELYVVYLDGTTSLLHTLTTAPEAFTDTPDPQTLNYPLATTGTIDATYLWEGPSEINTYTWDVLPGVSAGSASELGGQAYRLTYQPVTDYTGTTTAGSEAILFNQTTPNSTASIAFTNSSVVYAPDSHYILRAYEDYYTDYNFVVNETILRPDLISSLSAVPNKTGVPGVDDRVTITTDIIYSYQGNTPVEDTAYWFQNGDRVVSSQDSVSVPDPIPGGSYTWVSTPMPQYSPNPGFPPGPGKPAFPGATDTYEIQVRDSTGSSVIAGRVTVEKEVVLTTRLLATEVVYKDSNLSGFPTKGTSEWDETSSTNLRYKGVESLDNNTTYYVAMQAATVDYQYPITAFTTEDGGYLEFDLEVPTNNYIAMILDANKNIIKQYTKGDPLSFTYEQPDSLAVIAYGWWPIDCSVTQADISQSYDIEKALLKRAEPGDCNLVVKGLEGDPRSNSAIVIDAKIRVMLAAAASPTDDDEYLFSGFIETINTNYDVNGNIFTTINAVDALSKAMNVTIPVYEYLNEESFSRRMYNVFNDYIGPVTSGVTYDPSIWEAFEPYDRQVFPPEYRENVSSSEIITELTEGEYAILAQNRGGVISWFNRGVTAILVDSYQDLTLEAPDYGFSTVHSNSLDHFCITDFNIRNSIEDITNKVTVSLSYDELTSVTVEDAASIAKYGERAYEVQLNLDAPDADPSSEIQRWAEEVPNTEDQFELDSVSTAVVNRQGYVTNAFLIDITLDPCRVYLDVGPVDVNGVWMARRVRHSITPENWTMDLELTAD